jgi:predicted nucleic acid-binding protein
VNIPSRVWLETLAGARTFPAILPQLQSATAEGWLIIHPTIHGPQDAALDTLDDGEREAIALIRILSADLLIIDEQLGRAIAQRLGLHVTGTLGVLIEARKAGHITHIAPDLQRLRATTTFRFSKQLENTVLDLVGEPLIP